MSLLNLLSVVESERNHSASAVVLPSKLLWSPLSSSSSSSSSSSASSDHPFTEEDSAPSSPSGSDDQPSCVPGSEKRRLGSLSRSESHLASEKRRRASINDGFEVLRSVVPGCQPCHSKAELLKRAALHIRALTERCYGMAGQAQHHAKAKEEEVAVVEESEVPEDPPPAADGEIDGRLVPQLEAGKKRLHFATKYAEKLRKERDAAIRERDMYKEALTSLKPLLASSAGNPAPGLAPQPTTTTATNNITAVPPAAPETANELKPSAPSATVEVPPPSLSLPTISITPQSPESHLPRRPAQTFTFTACTFPVIPAPVASAAATSVPTPAPSALHPTSPPSSSSAPLLSLVDQSSSKAKTVTQKTLQALKRKLEAPDSSSKPWPAKRPNTATS